jgi:maltose O-acetyltransferase
MKSEREKMLAGELYDPLDAELAAMRRRARELTKAINDSGESQRNERAAMFAAAGEGLWIEPPFFCDYGSHVTLGSKVFFNFNCVILDPAQVEIGDHVLIGPAVQIYTALHPTSAAERRTGLELARPVAIGSDVWIGGGAIICPGVTIGAGSIIGAGSVATRDIPAGVFAAGNPCRVVRELAADQEPWA